jgi:hypothetical protein
MTVAAVVMAGLMVGVPGGGRLAAVFNDTLSRLQDAFERLRVDSLLGREIVHFRVASVAYQQPLIAIEHDHPVRHVFDRGVEPHVRLFE